MRRAVSIDLLRPDQAAYLCGVSSIFSTTQMVLVMSYMAGLNIDYMKDD